MTEQIIDGTGTGKLLKINADNKAEVVAVTQTEEAFYAELGFSFFVSTGVVTLNSTNPHLLMYIKNINAVLNMRVWVVNFTWNGGSTNHDRVMKWSLIGGLNAPTANHTLVTPTNFNFTSGITAEALVYKWDGVGDGMTYTGGGVGTEQLYDKGFTTNETRGLPILGLNDVVGLTMTGEEIGDVSIGTRFFYK